MVNTLKRNTNPDVLAKLGQIVRQKRLAAGLSQADLARQSALRQATISKAERGGDVTLDTLVKLLSAMNLEIAIVPVGQAGRMHSAPRQQGGRPLDLLEEFADLADKS